MSDPEKKCELCGILLRKRPKDSRKQWENKRFCSILCKNRSMPKTPIEVRFWRMVPVQRGEDTCWEWAGSLDNHGYGQISVGTGKAPAKAHRVSWEVHNGQLPIGSVVCHLCDNPSCVNPAHLVAADQKENMRQASTRGRLNPRSILNLRPGAKGFHGAGPISVGEKTNG